MRNLLMIFGNALGIVAGLLMHGLADVAVILTGWLC